MHNQKDNQPLQPLQPSSAVKIESQILPKSNTHHARKMSPLNPQAQNQSSQNQSSQTQSNHPNHPNQPSPLGPNSNPTPVCPEYYLGNPNPNHQASASNNWHSQYQIRNITWNVLNTLCWCQGDKQSCMAGPPDGCVGNAVVVGGFCEGCRTAKCPVVGEMYVDAAKRQLEWRARKQEIADVETMKRQREEQDRQWGIQQQQQLQQVQGQGDMMNWRHKVLTRMVSDGKSDAETLKNEHGSGGQIQLGIPELTQQEKLKLGMKFEKAEAEAAIDALRRLAGHI